jgi:uncharacterized protein (TIGR02466 family)
MKESQTHNLFPTPIYINKIDREFTKKEIDFVNNEINNCKINHGNISSLDSYILNRLELNNIKTFIQKCCNDYLSKIISPNNNIKLYITQSWLNYTKENQYHHRHNHTNSIISGVLYFNSNKDNDNIKFFNSKNSEQISIETNNYNIWNSNSWWFPVETGQIIMFPSSTEHQVDNKKGNNTRISLAFNTFYKGLLGSNENMTELKL